MTRQTAERRKTDRVDSGTADAKIELAQNISPAVLKNISMSGLACISYASIPEMTVVEMKIQLPALPEEKNERHSFACKGAVVRCEPINNRNSKRKWLLAIFFTEVNSSNKQILEKYINCRT